MTNDKPKKTNSNTLKFAIAGGLLLIAVVFMIVSATKSSAEFFMTVREVKEASNDLIGQNLRVSGAVIGESIAYDGGTGKLRFDIAHITSDKDDIKNTNSLGELLHQAVIDPENPRLTIIYHGSPPDMLRDEAQAILTGTLNAEGIFLAEELLLKCPSKYEEALPSQLEK